VSTGIHGGFTFGSGRLDFDGYWEFPCRECAEAWEKMHPEDEQCWPYHDMQGGWTAEEEEAYQKLLGGADW